MGALDRFFYKGTLPRTLGKNVVIDFLDFYAFPDIWPWVFNVADSFVCVGAAILVIYYITDFAITSVKTQQVAADVAAAEQENSVSAEASDLSADAECDSEAEEKDNTTEGGKQ